ncbi:MAG: hypothetical protein AB7L41_06760, partial [Flavobacteriaceae bacterium]
MAAVSFALPASAQTDEPLAPGEAVITVFSGSVAQGGREVLDADGVVAGIVDLRSPPGEPDGGNWADAPRRSGATAGEIGQVFGIAIDDGDVPAVFLGASSVYGLFRKADGGWMDGMWGKDGGPGSVWVLDPANGMAARKLTDVTLDGRPNSGPGLGNLAFDRWNGQLYVSDLETGMIHRLRPGDGADLGRYDHGATGRNGFYDMQSGELVARDPVPFDPASAARSDCPQGDFAATPACWNVADFRRRVWGLAVRRDARTQEVRLYYSVAGGDALGSPGFAEAESDDRRNSVWSIGIRDDGDFDLARVRREFVLPDFYRPGEDGAAPERFSSPVADIAFPAFGAQTVMLVGERGDGSDGRVLRYELTETGIWRLAGRYDVGYGEREQEGPPFVRAGAAGGVSFGSGYGENAAADAFVWMSGDTLCTAQAPCPGGDEDASGLVGRAERPYDAAEPFNAFEPYPDSGPATPPAGLERSYIVGIGSAAMGDVEFFQSPATEVADAGDELPYYVPPFYEPPFYGPPEPGWDPAPLPPGGWFPPPPFPLDTDLAIDKDGPAQCQEGVECSYKLTVTNTGSVAYTGPVAIADTMPPGATLASASPGWNCAVTGSVAACVTQGPALLTPGDTATITLDLLLPANIATPTIENCGAIDWFE